MKKLALLLVGIVSLFAVSVSASNFTSVLSDPQNIEQTPCYPAPCAPDTVCNPAPCYPAPCAPDTVCNPAPCYPGC